MTKRFMSMLALSTLIGVALVGCNPDKTDAPAPVTDPVASKAPVDPPATSKTGTAPSTAPVGTTTK